jgi:hypothetical protein
MPTAEDFKRELFHMMANAQKSARKSIEISARERYARSWPSLRTESSGLPARRMMLAC